jgi:hypothetical protein
MVWRKMGLFLHPEKDLIIEEFLIIFVLAVQDARATY